ncbi:alcohol dehydrogenase catalytic domain-containing protein [Aquimarina sp. U1-2]|uniref:MDR/zinc-dependent alcohol dehydrogenase-like family protein n=1 Tax=Aquimarina sp. U1-2 TaxID=2823141 RepID=UPI001AED0744|nr:medium chain dehydrogenase/reductase family protein [Aquimarina sp. U1-2]MBP2832397.1 alcohol dehydrogenase catalytic domain-containing protein [Aquimarina sp. U1-2]
MRALAVLSPSIDAKVDQEQKYYLTIDSLKIPLALIHVPDTVFKKDDAAYANLVLVKKVGFSLNYRDLGVIERAWRGLKELEQDSYYPIGSDFCGYVEEVGQNVKNLKKGDLVISDCFYPESKNGYQGGIPTNHGSKEYEILPEIKLLKLPDHFPVEQAAAMSIGTQTAINMIERAQIKEGSNVLVTSVTSNTSLFLLNFLKTRNCNVYGLSYSGENFEKVKQKFPFLKDIYSLQLDNIPTDLQFDAVLDPFSDTYLPYLLDNDRLKTSCYYVTCGIFSQSRQKRKDGKEVKLHDLFAKFIAKNINFIGNCLGPTSTLEQGVRELCSFPDHNIIMDSVYSEEKSLKEFIRKTFNVDKNRFGKVSFMYT